MTRLRKRLTPLICALTPRSLLPMLLLMAACSAPPPSEPEPSTSPTPEPSTSPTPEPSTSATPEPSTSMLPGLGLPGRNLNEPAGDYGWTGSGLGAIDGMHYVVGDDSEFRQTQLTFSVSDD
jgi:hypothetical protein